MGQGFEEDTADNKEEALELYMQAAELCLKLVSNSPSINLLDLLAGSQKQGAHYREK